MLPALLIIEIRRYFLICMVEIDGIILHYTTKIISTNINNQILV